MFASRSITTSLIVVTTMSSAYALGGGGPAAMTHNNELYRDGNGRAAASAQDRSAYQKHRLRRPKPVPKRRSAAEIGE